MKKVFEHLLVVIAVFIVSTVLICCIFKIASLFKDQSEIQASSTVVFQAIKGKDNFYCNELGTTYYRFYDSFTPYLDREGKPIPCERY